jgi:hypothetical protein
VQLTQGRSRERSDVRNEQTEDARLAIYFPVTPLRLWDPIYTLPSFD